MADDVLIVAENVSKKFCKDLKKSLWYGINDLATGILGREKKSTLRPSEFQAVSNISFEVRRGECLGLVGHNGAGKSTLLKMLNGLISPDGGKIEMRGRVGALIELGAGFNPILTGRENIFNNAAVLGFSKQETLSRMDEIIAFSEIEEFLDTPLQNYSSGMKVRLGFAVAAQMKPDILLIDEVLAVGDMGFVLKCFNKMDELLKDTAMILVSHNMPQISRMCTDILLMQKGKSLYQSSDVGAGITRYYELFSTTIGNFTGSGKAMLKNIRLSSGKNSDINPGEKFLLESGKELTVTLEVKFEEPVYNPRIFLAFYDREQRNFAEINNFNKHICIEKAEGLWQFDVTIPSAPFAQGVYSITVGLVEEKEGGRSSVFRNQSAVYFTVHNALHGW
ncbi:MAG: ABC transporter ATP-binding protein, partial [Crocinitomicaceae bacterium]|nr:ABC transporter ATP-binding protein [Crocinitomicaceae bacterium]